jgi:hypothetical protein
VAAEDLAVFYRELSFESAREGEVGGFCLWFDVAFEGQAAGAEPVVLSTSPEAAPTHWKQTSVLLPEPVRVAAGGPVRCALTLAADPDNERRYDISVDLLPADGAEDEDMADVTFGEHPRSCDCLQCVLTRETTRAFNARDSAGDARQRD